jgi:acetyl-CoA C-acetyltransferase
MYIVDVKRTPIGKFLGKFANLPAPQLASPLFTYFINKYSFLKNNTDEVIMGNVISAGIGLNPARLVAYQGGIKYTVPSYTVNHACASGLNAIIQGFRSIITGNAELVLAGGMESMSSAPYLVKGARHGLKFGSYRLIDSLENDGLYCSLSDALMGATAENVARKFKIKRKQQDQYALVSHIKALAAQKNKVFSSDIIALAGGKADEGIRQDTSINKLSALKPAFKRNGTVTAGNSSSLSDGAALSLLASEKALKKYHLKPKARILDSVFVGIKPEIMGMGPKFAIEKLLKKRSLSLGDIDLFEINEAFAAQVLAVINDLKIDTNKVNIYGGAIALGLRFGMCGV